LKELDPEFHSGLDWITRNTIDNSGLGLSFSAETHLFGGHEVVDLVPGGRDIAVNDANKGEYVRKMAEWKTSRVIERHLRELRRGFEIHARPSIMKTVTPVELYVWFCTCGAVRWCWVCVEMCVVLYVQCCSCSNSVVMPLPPM
jgi:hypothetical protein